MAAVMEKASAALATSPEPRKLRIGLFADSRLQPRWVAEAFAKVARSGFAEIVLIAAGGTAPSEPALWKLYNGVDRWAFGRSDDPGERVDLATVPHRKLTNDLDARVDLDVAFALGAIDDSRLDGAASHGVWRFHFGDGDGIDAGRAANFPGFREVARGEPLSYSGVKVRLASGAPARLAYQSWSRTYPLSAARNREQLLTKTAEFALRALRDLHSFGPEWLEQCKTENRGQTPISASDAGGFGGIRGLTPISRIGARILHRGVEKALHVEQWFLAYRFREARFGDARAIPSDLRGFVRLMPPKDRYWADPFALEKNGRYFVFFEELPFKTGRAHISMFEIDRETGRASEPVRVLERDYHLSYPFLVESDGQLYMIPETAQKGTVEVYRCIDFPLRWKLERVMMEGLRCVDATFHRAADRWWMFANAAASGSRMFDDELHLFHSDKLLGDWQPHARNPVKSDARCARPAGQLYWRNGTLYRPAQICAPLYGSGLSINRVLRLTPQEYVERQVERILPAAEAGLLGLHTVNRAGDLTVVDGFVRRSRFCTEVRWNPHPDS
jgi:hypothetical protein